MRPLARFAAFPLAALLLVLTATACKPGPTAKVKYKPGAAAKVLNVQMTDLQPAIAARIQSSDRPAWVTEERWKKVRSLYARFGNSPLWLEEGGMKDRAGALIAALRTAPDHALDTTSYPISEIEKVASEKLIIGTSSAAAIADADVLLTAAYVAYAADMLAGQVDPKTVSQAWHIGANRTELDSALVRSLEETDMKGSLEAMAPQDDDYRILKVAYASYRQIASSSGGWPAVPTAKGPARDAALHARLDAAISADSIVEIASDSVTKNVAPASDAPVDSLPTHAAPIAAHGPALLSEEVKNFQERHGLERTGVLNKVTIDAINVPVEERVKQIAANMERHRWLPRTLGSRYVYVNVPAFRVDAYDNGQKVLSMKVVVGQEYEGRTTPVFSDSMETVVFRPYWNITPDIQAEEIAPKVAADPGYLARNNMEYYRDGNVRRIRQTPGEKNSLGLVKFLFPNNFNIYLHDTPAKTLFAQADRAASHGCIRLEKPAELAQWVLGWDADRVQQAMNGGGDNKSVRIPTKIPVYIVYFTAYVRAGRLFFADDVYNRDEALVEKVAVTN